MVSILEIARDVHLTDRRLFPIWDKVQEEKRLTLDEGVTILETDDFAGVGRIADFAKKRVTGDKVYFVLNRHINPTNICVLSCKFCDFAKKPGQENAYEMSMDEILAHMDSEIREVHIVGGHHPTWTFEYYVDMVRTIHEKYPQVQIKAFTASEIDYFHRRWKVPPEESLARFKEAGLESMPGGGAEVFSPRVHKMLLPGKANADRWAEIHKTAHRMGINSNCTLLYGHIETFEERLDHMLRLRAQQDESGGFLSFIPLAFQPDNNQLAKELGTRFTTGIDDLRNLAVARLMLDNFPHVKGYWIMITPELTQVSLSAGVSDIDGTIKAEKIAHASGAVTEEGMTEDELLRLIREAGRVPVRRDALYNELRVYA